MAKVTHIETLTPDNLYSQSEAYEVMKELVTDRKALKYLKGIYENSGIEKRHSVIKDLTKAGGSDFFRSQGSFKEPSTKVRNDIYTKEVKSLITTLASRLKNRINCSSITHVITVSCTGFYSPGPDIDIVKALKLSDNTQRFHLGFMGCYGAFPALKMAKQFCEANIEANVLIVCIELCSLHFQLGSHLDTLMANSLFSDGIGAALVSNSDCSGIYLNSFDCSLVSSAEKDMAWSVGDLGFDMILTKYVARVLESELPQMLDKVFSLSNTKKEDVDIWAVHPGGKSIVDKVQKSLSLREHQVSASKNILKNFGNMSSATILFVLKEIMENTQKDSIDICSLAFGPGLTVEQSLMTYTK